MKVGICPFRGRIYEGLVGVLLVLGIRGVDGVSAGVLVIKGLGITKRKISIFLSRAQRNLTQPILVSYEAPPFGSNLGKKRTLAQ